MNQKERNELSRHEFWYTPVRNLQSTDITVRLSTGSAKTAKSQRV